MSESANNVHFMPQRPDAPLTAGEPLVARQVSADGRRGWFSSSRAPSASSRTYAPDTAIYLHTPSAFERLQLWMVGHRQTPYDTAGDVHVIKRNALPLAVSMSMGLFGASVFIARYNLLAGAAAATASLATMAALGIVDRLIISSEGEEKAHAAAMKDLVEAGVVKRTKLQRLGQSAAHVFRVAPRMAISAIMSSLVAAPVIMTIAQGEIKDELLKTYRLDNQTLFEQVDAQKSGYDREIADLAHHAQDDRAQIEQQKRTSLGLAANGSPAQAALGTRAEKLDADIATQQRTVAEDQARLDGEVGGVNGYKGVSGLAGNGPIAAKDRLELSKDKQILADLLAQRATLQSQMDAAAQRDAQNATAREKQQQALAQMGSAIEQDLADTQTHLKAMQDSRDMTFQNIEDGAKADPTYKPVRSGPLAEGAALERWITTSDGYVAKGIFAGLTGILLLLDMSAVIGALTRRVTQSEKRTAKERLERQMLLGDELVRHGAQSAALRAGVKTFMSSMENDPTKQIPFVFAQRPVYANAPGPMSVNSQPIGGTSYSSAIDPETYARMGSPIGTAAPTPKPA